MTLSHLATGWPWELSPAQWAAHLWLAATPSPCGERQGDGQGGPQKASEGEMPRDGAEAFLQRPPECQLEENTVNP